ncbi:dihydrofolate reductase [Alloalcanivorax profundimaris]|uniref:Dihydrofolate reductase n=1 Tax=Alloalcanivorax profundimaris TaxID=2735259 RepID=A0ABS0ANH8_9GAMM|nr:dihydrofolate reductase [Alloalcanivorax profundimaris]MAY10828.1 dihydrofolate reductase [Alcanivorax sp.]MBM1144261.1 dihydrofolate reductase [Alcanivorax sp. ZXX171]UWN50607.1 Dihydrofolate reductase type 3 [Alcanivorax sp. ALC70]MBF1802493.1 dihydrofolate reductase [Alloalcanivorax profundimaris]MBF5055177.1 dihydrofolate reductase [Alloalcanivorax profundimaris]|tara:strand:- start:490 stop:999 length:510 start_codon:yes stop_codon:yes gene_type:complete
MSIRLAMMAAKASNNVIGRDNKLPWYLPNDLKYFKQVTLGKPIVMGRNTWESLKRPLPGRTNIVISRQADYVAEGAKVVGTLDEALELAGHVAHIDGQDELVVIGGAQIYALALPRAERLYLTEVHADVPGDTYFPAVDAAQWREIGRDDFQAEGPNPYDYSFVVYERA